MYVGTYVKLANNEAGTAHHVGSITWTVQPESYVVNPIHTELFM